MIKYQEIWGLKYPGITEVFHAYEIKYKRLIS